MDYSKYIYTINDANDGTGVIVDGFLITAGHVVSGCPRPSIYVLGQTFNLTVENLIYFDDNISKNEMGYDLAIFKLEGLNNPLTLADDLPNKYDKLISLSYNTSISKVKNSGVGIFANTDKIEKTLEQLTGRVIEYYGNYYECMMEGFLCGGRSGSPLFNGNEVVGILIGDREGKKSSNTVLYLSSKAIVGILKKRGYGK